MKQTISSQKVALLPYLTTFALIQITEDAPIEENDVWVVISSYFDSKGLVRQQLDSFNDFVKYSLSEIVEGQEDIILAPAHKGGKADKEVGVLYFIYAYSRAASIDML